MQLVAYVLARCGSPNPKGGGDLPPAWLGAATWRDAYGAFYEPLGDGRTLQTFRNSLKNARDAFDAHVASNRVGWVDRKSGGLPYRQDQLVGRVLSQWGDKSDDELRDAAMEILEAGAQLDLPEEHGARTEGGQKVYLARKYERDPRLRQEAINIHGRDCMGCGFSFDERYGSAHSRGYIEVHHCVPLSAKGVRETDPRTDLVVLCSNCHRMVHRSRDICLSLDELKAKLAAAAHPEPFRAPAAR
jgi:5-methylcytosine-specific restriction endonuclease McrA